MTTPHLNVSSADADHELRRVQDRLALALLIRGGAELAATLGPHARAEPRSLDLIGHSTSDDRLLTLGDLVVDARRPAVVALFTALRASSLLDELQVDSIRLLGCMTATTPAGRETIRTLADVTRREVVGTRQLLHAAHFD